jgi:hypothetical protein
MPPVPNTPSLRLQNILRRSGDNWKGLSSQSFSPGSRKADSITVRHFPAGT